MQSIITESSNIAMQLTAWSRHSVVVDSFKSSYFYLPGLSIVNWLPYLRPCLEAKNHFGQKLDLESWGKRMAPSNTALMDAFTYIWAASVNQMVLIPIHMCSVKCPLGSSEHLMGVTSTCIEEMNPPVTRKNECIFLCTEPLPWLWGGRRDVVFK